MVRITDSSTGDILETYIYHPTEDRILIKYSDYQGTNNAHSAVLYINDNFVREYTNLLGTPKVEDTYYIRDSSGIVAEVVRNVSYLDDDYELIKTLYHHNDHLGSTSVITNESGEIVEETFYDPYGTILDGGSESRFDYEGKEFSSVTEDYDYNFRKYNPEVGLFTQPDAVFSNIYDPQSLNRYRFERNNPYFYKDPNGKWAVQIQGGIGGTWETVGGSASVGVAFSYSKEHGFQISPVVNAGGGISYGVIGKAFASLGITPTAKKIRDISGSSFSIGGAVAYGPYGGGYSYSEGEFPTHTISYAPGIGAQYNIYESYTKPFLIFGESSNRGVQSSWTLGNQFSMGGYTSNIFAIQTNNANILRPSEGSVGGRCMCTAPPASGRTVVSQSTTTGGGSVWGGVKKEASNIWKGIKNIFGGIF
ncbi:hypothetical protein J4429_03015 [Candidatus Pacearchaeota archaeon]|nr:hypothetical protein [Candidatus Pacearchaeota archaeon]